ncbi:response regulator transcription factor [Litoribacter ruber]|uniref:LytR/AlgR family response regulator transcription factor n=1 Tax=Litoribacter ruber TaxID=702568 RepID=UPI001BDA7A7D|nr:LytTR family DNA-binding domain-containing protein [Litoribacter ruber]MBT0810495.1 response regulator transcription factor [Litoribacter ruber]
MNIALLDDEKHCLESLALDLKQVAPEAEIVFKSTKPEKALEKIPDLEVDLLFLDVQMPKLNGFEFLEQLAPNVPDVIFTTAYSRYAIQAFRYHAFNYLLKPIDEKELATVVDHWRQKRERDRLFQETTIEGLLEKMKRDGIFQSKIAVPVFDGYEFIEIKDILFCRSESNYTTFFLENDGQILICKTLKEVESILNKHHFIRIHQSYLVNPHHMTKFQRSDGGYVIMKNGEKIKVSSQKKDLVTGFFETVRKN